MEQTSRSDKTEWQGPQVYLHKPDLLPLIPEQAQRILLVGCGDDKLGEELKRRRQRHVLGIEADPQAAGEARKRLDEVIVAEIEGVDIAALGRFDCVVCDDVITRLKQPWVTLGRLRQALEPTGSFIARFLMRVNSPW